MPTNKTFIFVHGAWHASWCWQDIATALRAQGHTVLTPDLPGHGTNLCPTHTIQFDDYVTSIITLIKKTSQPVTLIGHSMAGLIISQVAEIIPKRIHELIFLAAYIPQNNESLFSIAETSDSHQLSPYLIIDPIKQVIRLESSPELINIFFNRSSRADAKHAIAQLQPEPLQPFQATVSLGENFKNIAKRAFVSQDDQALVLSDQLRMSQAVTDDITFLDADHAVYYSGKYDIIRALSS